MEARHVRGVLKYSDNFVLPLALLLALVTVTFLGAGNLRTCSLLGLMLCALGLIRDRARLDWFGTGLLVSYVVLSSISSCAVYGEHLTGYAPFHSIYPVLFLLTGAMDEKQHLLTKRLTVFWVSALGGWCLFRYTWKAVAEGGAGRLSGPLGNPNATGIFFVIAWLILWDCQERETELLPRPLSWLLPRLEPLLLIAAALTLSMGSFGAMAAGAVFLAARSAESVTSRGILFTFLSVITRAGLGMGIGFLLYLGAARTGTPLCCLPVFVYALAAICLWPQWAAFLRENPGLYRIAALAGALVSVSLFLVLRPSALSTFWERLEMMKSAAVYLTRNPLLGLGPYQWRLCDLNDGGTYFATWHIHNVPLHLAVETGWPAAAAITTLALRGLRQQKSPGAKGALAAFCVHNLMDTSFFYMGVTALIFLTAMPRGMERETGPWPLRIMFGGFAFFFGMTLCLSLI